MEEHDKVNTTKGEYPFNAEFSLDWASKEAKFRYPFELPATQVELEHKKDMVYFSHLFVQVGASVLALVLLFVFTHYTNSILNPDKTMTVIIGSGHIGLWLGAYVVFLYAWIAFLVVACMVLLGYISLMLHRNNKWLRDNLPTTNSYFKKLVHRTIKIDLSKKGGRHWFKIAGNILIPRMSSTLCELEIPDSISSHITRIYSVCVNDKPSIMSTGFWLIIETDLGDYDLIGFGNDKIIVRT
jgi:hypothetical protein